MADDIALLGGFRQPVFDAQATFRLLMTAMAQPGSRHVVTAEVSAPDGLGLARTALVLTLVDADAPVWLAAPTPRLAAWLAFHTGARLVADAADAVEQVQRLVIEQRHRARQLVGPADPARHRARERRAVRRRHRAAAGEAFAHAAIVAVRSRAVTAGARDPRRGFRPQRWSLATCVPGGAGPRGYGTSR